jgi:hypothetical protein
MNQNKIGLTKEGEEALLDLLETFKNVYVTFRTKKGNEREMHCSRASEHVPQEGKLDSRLNGPEIIAVYDHQNSAWRSFRKDSVLYFEYDTKE